ncbi:MAG: hypothetical protein L6R41_001433 [Letrouitia leprolyta]|nr:MAG: hypothetical protein L6R41_001433 [Letrouitia leprolyta]
MAFQSVLPEFDSLPLHPEDPPHSAWGLYEPNDQLGSLNRLTDETVTRAAREEIQTGSRYGSNTTMLEHNFSAIEQSYGRISLNWPLDAQKYNRTSEGDGLLRHFAYQKEKKFYNGVTLEDIHLIKESNVNGIHAWANKGIIGRGILLDFHSWRLAHNITYNPFETGVIPLEQMQAVLKYQGTEVRFGDILFIRSGYADAFSKLTQVAIEEFASVVPPHLSGVEQSKSVLEWIWNNFSAVAGDQPSFECWPMSGILTYQMNADDRCRDPRRLDAPRSLTFRVGYANR